jgi:hypothetical protein
MMRRAGLGDVDELGAIAAAAYEVRVPDQEGPAPMTADYAQAVRDGQAWAALEDGQIVSFAVIIAQPGYTAAGQCGRPDRSPGPRDRRPAARTG